MRYVRIRSWHRVALTYRSGMVGTRCGRGPLAVEGTLSPARALIHATSDTIPLTDRSCETCLRLAAHDQDAAGELDPSGEVPHP